MKTFHVQLGRGLKVDVLKLVETRVGICANSGAGKTYLMRLLIEQIGGRIPIHILDWEGEYVTLRSQIDAVYVAKGGDIAPQPRTAHKLALKLLEKRVSAILDVSSLPRVDRLNFVGAYLEGLLDAPAALWTPILVFIDEAHRTIPEVASKGGGKDLISAIHRARAAGIALMDSGRKRGMGGVIASQRIAKVAKDALGEGNNKFFGRFVQDTDLKRVGEDLGLDRGHRDAVKRFKPGEFFAQGPALQDPGKTYRFRSTLPKTKTPKFGDKGSPSRPSKTMKKVLEELATLPEEVAQEIRDLKEAKARIKLLERELKLVPKLKRAEVSKEMLEVAERRGEQRGSAKQVKLFKTTQKQLDAWVRRFGTTLLQVQRGVADLDDVRAKIASHLAFEVPELSAVAAVPKVYPEAPKKFETKISKHPVNGKLPFSWKSAPGKMFTVLLQYHPEELKPSRAASLAGVNVKSSTYRGAMAKLRSFGFVDGMVVTDEGLAHQHDVEPLPEGDELIEGWRHKLGNGAPRQVFDALVEANGEADRDAIATAADIDPTSSTWRGALAKLRKLGLLERGGAGLRFTEHVQEALR